MTKTDNIEKCNLQNAKALCIKYLEKQNLMTFNPELNVTDSLNVYLIEVNPKSKLVKGGGGKFKVSKKDCKIIDVELYQ
jgi:hypothetical protein